MDNETKEMLQKIILSLEDINKSIKQTEHEKQLKEERRKFLAIYWAEGITIFVMVICIVIRICQSVFS